MDGPGQGYSGWKSSSPAMHAGVLNQHGGAMQGADSVCCIIRCRPRQKSLTIYLDPAGLSRSKADKEKKTGRNELPWISDF
jgi:hypothetical protein